MQLSGYDSWLTHDPRDDMQVAWERWYESDAAQAEYGDYLAGFPVEEGMDNVLPFDQWADTRLGERAFEVWMDSFGEVE